jgi:hypothetical protein
MCRGTREPRLKIEFAEDVAAFANTRGGAILVGIADQPRIVVGIDRGRELEDRLQFASTVLKAHLEYDRDLVTLEQVVFQDNTVSKLCLVVVVAQACEVVGVTDGKGHFTYPVRLQTGKHRGTRIQVASMKAHIKSDNFDFIEELLRFVRDHSPAG